MTRAQVEEFVGDGGWEDILLCDGFDDAFVGISQCFTRTAAVYDYEKCVAILMERDGMEREEADEYMDFNVLGAYVGETTPVFMMATISESGPWGPQ
jgi:hypothetical protein